MITEKQIDAAVRARRAMLIGKGIAEGLPAEKARKDAEFTLRSWLRDRVQIRNKSQLALRRWCIKHIEGF